MIAWLPNYIKWPLIIISALVILPFSAYRKAQSFVQEEVHAYILPMKDKRDAEIVEMKSDIRDIKEATGRIETILMSK
jgi:hypothetical protein